MSTTTSTAENATGTADRSIDHDRYTRACAEPMMVTPIAPGMATVGHNDADYGVDLDGGACECPDSHYCPDTYCKHTIKAALVTIFTEGVTTAFVARIVRYITEHPCPHGNDHLCDGPLGPRFPCPECVEATTVDEWTVWQMTEQRTGERR